MRRVLAILLMLNPVAPGVAATLVLAKSVRVVSDTVNTLNLHMLPGGTVDYLITATNQADILLNPIRNVVIEESIPVGVRLRVVNLDAGSGPVAFEDGGLLGSGLLASGATYSFVSLASQTDGLEFWNGTRWDYVPQPDGGGYDAAVRAIRVRMGGTQVAGRAFRLRYRVLIP